MNADRRDALVADAVEAMRVWYSDDRSRERSARVEQMIVDPWAILRDLIATVEREAGSVPCPAPTCFKGKATLGPYTAPGHCDCRTCSGRATVPEWYAVLLEAADWTENQFSKRVSPGAIRDWARKRLEQTGGGE